MYFEAIIKGVKFRGLFPVGVSWRAAASTLNAARRGILLVGNFIRKFITNFK